MYTGLVYGTKQKKEHLQPHVSTMAPDTLLYQVYLWPETSSTVMSGKRCSLSIPYMGHMRGHPQQGASGPWWTEIQIHPFITTRPRCETTGSASLAAYRA